MTGSYLGQGLNVSYVGDFAQYAAIGTISWTATGTWASAVPNWVETGSAVFTSINATSFSIAYSYSITIAADTFVSNQTIVGAIDGAGHYSFTGTADNTTFNAVPIPLVKFKSLRFVPPRRRSRRTRALTLRTSERASLCPMAESSPRKSRHT